MNKTTYKIICCIPIVGSIFYSATCMRYSSPGRSDHVYDKIFEYSKKHPNVQITRQLGDKILRGEIK